MTGRFRSRVARTLMCATLALWPIAGCANGESAGQVASGKDTSSDAGSAPRPLVEGDPRPLPPGSYQLGYHLAGSARPPEAFVDVPNGFDEEASWYVVSHDRDEFLGLWIVSGVDRDACRGGSHDSYDPGPSVEDLSRALAAQKSTRASTPKPVTLAGYRGLYIEVASPRDLSTCGHEARLWTSGPTGGRGIYNDGQVDLVWVLDAGGQRIVVNASYSARSTASDVEKLTSMVGSLTFAAPAE